MLNARCSVLDVRAGDEPGTLPGSSREAAGDKPGSFVPRFKFPIDRFPPFDLASEILK
jgi:hypothetical protein